MGKTELVDKFTLTKLIEELSNLAPESVCSMRYDYSELVGVQLEPKGANYTILITVDPAVAPHPDKFG